MRIIGGKFRSRILDVPKGEITRPTTSQVRACVFNICQGYIEGSHFADIFAGSGAIGLEAISRGAKCCTFIEQDKEACLCIKKNIERLGVLDQCTLLCKAVHHALVSTKTPFDICYIDPPYGEDVSLLLSDFDQKPLLTNGASVFYEARYQKGQLQTFDYLQHLTLESSRKIGDTVLYHFYKGSML